MDKVKLASGLSAILNAPMITLFTFIPLIILHGMQNAVTLLTITGFFGSFLPLIMVYGLLKFDFIKDFYAHEKDTRYIPFLWTTLFYLLGVISLYYVNAPTDVTALMACYFVNGLILLTITMKWKISIHASGVTGPVTALIHQLGSAMLPLLIIVIPVAWARMELKAHNMKQILAGAFLSGSLTWIQMSFYLHKLPI